MARVDQHLTDSFLLTDFTHSQKIQFRKMHAKNKNKSEQRQEGPEGYEKRVKKAGKKGKSL